MTFKIGFHAKNDDNTDIVPAPVTTIQPSVIRKSLVEVYFPKRDRAYTYYNDRFDLHEGDNVFVEGKLEGIQGVVTNVNYNFRIKLSDYKRVISVVDTKIRGELFIAGDALVSFDRAVMPYEKILSWFMPVSGEEEEIVSGSDDLSFPLAEPEMWPIEPDVMGRGFDYLRGGNVKYLCLDGESGRAIVDGSRVYDVRFRYSNGEISELTCDCYYSALCKHDAAALMFFKSALDIILDNYIEQFEASNYFAAVSKATLFLYTVKNAKTGRFTLE